MYDVTIPYPSPLKVKDTGPFAFVLANTSQTPLHDLMLLQSDHGHWRRADVGELAVATTTAPATGPSPNTGPTTAPTTHPRYSASAKLQSNPPTQPPELAERWRPALLKAGVADTDCDTIAKLITGIVGDSARMVAIYRMDDAEFDRLLPIEVVPQPTKTHPDWHCDHQKCRPRHQQRHRRPDRQSFRSDDADWSKRRSRQKNPAQNRPVRPPAAGDCPQEQRSRSSFKALSGLLAPKSAG